MGDFSERVDKPSGFLCMGVTWRFKEGEKFPYNIFTT